jgi:hypothetical protein
MTYFRVFTPFVFGFATLAAAHSWIEQLSNVAPDGSFVTDYGYPRSFVDKGSSNFDQNANLWLIPPPEQHSSFVNQANLLCHPSQRTQNQSPGFPRLQTAPGSMVAMRYAENGHATIPGGGTGLLGKPEKGGTAFVFGTSQPQRSETLLDVLQWTHDGRGGDGRGRLLTSQNFDDGRCYQLGNGADLASWRKAHIPNPLVGQPGTEHEVLCETDVPIPLDIEVGKPYTLYWVWQWPNAPGKDPNLPSGKDEYYTSCADLDVVRIVPPKPRNHPLLQQDPIPTAVSDFQSRSALTVDPLALYSNPASNVRAKGRG